MNEEIEIKLGLFILMMLHTLFWTIRNIFTRLLQPVLFHTAKNSPQAICEWWSCGRHHCPPEVEQTIQYVIIVARNYLYTS